MNYLKLHPFHLLALFCCATLVALGVAPSQAYAQASDEATAEIIDPDTFIPNLKPTLSLGQRLGDIVIDGELDDTGWMNAAVAQNFSETFPEEQIQPEIGIRAWMTYDDQFLYVAFKIEDDPSSIRRSLVDRDNMWQDDYVGVILDTYGTNAWQYFIASNPLGIQGDTRIITGANEDEGFNIIYDSEGQVTDEGYQVEMRIPFRSLRFPEADVQNWSVNFWVNHPREDRNRYSWAAISRDDPCWSCQFGKTAGLEGVKSERNFEILPSVTGTQAGSLVDGDNPSSGFDNGRIRFEPSLGLKYGITPDVTADLTLNPDFSQIEADAAQIDVNSTFALFFRERRPFFQEGSELFNTNYDVVYTRSINNPSVAGKLTGRFGRTDVAYIGAHDQDSPIILPFEEQSRFVQGGSSFSNIVRLRQAVGERSFVGGLVTDRRFQEGGAGSTMSVDGRLQLSQNYGFEWHLVGSRVEEGVSEELSEDLEDLTFDSGNRTAAFDGEQYNGYATYMSFERQSDRWWFDLDHYSVSPTFRASNGFETQNSINRATGVTGYQFQPGNFFSRIQPVVFAGYEWNFDNLRKDRWVGVNLNLSMKGQTNAGFNWVIDSDEVFAEQEFDNLRSFNAWLFSSFSQTLRMGGWFNYGRRIARNADPIQFGRGFDYGVDVTMRPLSNLSFTGELNHASMDAEDDGEELFSGYIGRLRTNYQINRRLFIRLVTQYNGFSDRLDIDPLVTYRVNPFTAFYVGSTHDFNNFGAPFDGYRQSARQVFFKFQYLVRA